MWGASQNKSGLITYGTMTAFLELANRIQTPAYDMLKMVPALISSKTSVERLEELEVLSKEKDGESLFLGEKLSL